MKHKKLIWSISILLSFALLTGAALYFLPWPTRIDMQLHGTLVSEDGQEQSMGTFSIRGWKLNYLFQEDKVDLDISLPEEYGWQYVQNTNGSFQYNSMFDMAVPYIVSTCPMVTVGNQHVGHFALSTEEGLFVIYNKAKPDAPYFIGSVSSDRDASDIMEYFSVFLNSWLCSDERTSVTA